MGFSFRLFLYITVCNKNENHEPPNCLNAVYKSLYDLSMKHRLHFYGEFREVWDFFPGNRNCCSIWKLISCYGKICRLSYFRVAAETEQHWLRGTVRKRPANLVQTIERADELLDALSKAPEGLSLGELARPVGLAKGTTLRYERQHSGCHQRVSTGCQSYSGYRTQLDERVDCTNGQENIQSTGIEILKICRW